ncbi:hypothetical protein TorRG33x02_132490 [Trema orientale]|uniref:Uncharacterized protein n=1 Tax=Trema orientale TaxID=63057 RepID=A0A2P5EZT2_TREOI|nr:hypothetical protein TorRG33x02_132490 [Trema orientale]
MAGEGKSTMEGRRSRIGASDEKIRSGGGSHAVFLVWCGYSVVDFWRGAAAVWSFVMREGKMEEK